MNVNDDVAVQLVCNVNCVLCCRDLQITIVFPFITVGPNRIGGDRAQLTGSPRTQMVPLIADTCEALVKGQSATAVNCLQAGEGRGEGTCAVSRLRTLTSVDETLIARLRRTMVNAVAIVCWPAATNRLTNEWRAEKARSDFNFNPWAKFQKFRRLTPNSFWSFGQFQHWLCDNVSQGEVAGFNVA